jgi:hypothetical protein
MAPSDAGLSEDASTEDLSPNDARMLLRRAWLEGDIRIAINVGKAFENTRHFACTRPGVLWRQGRVSIKSPLSSNMSFSEGGGVFRRSLQQQELGDDTQASSSRFVPQRHATDVSDINEDTMNAEALQGFRFKINLGTALHNNAEFGDVDKLLEGEASVTTMQTWPFSHLLSLQDQVFLRGAHEPDDKAYGLPLWLTEQR